MSSRSPHGERGLKYQSPRVHKDNQESLSSRRAWIEIELMFRIYDKLAESLSSRRAWIEIDEHWVRFEMMLKSLSSRRAWIEIRNNNKR